jgi:hypothetical protein
MSFTILDTTDFVVSSDSVTAPAWSGNTPTLTNFYTASTGVSSSFYVNVYNLDPININSAVQFSIAYGEIGGLGSAPINQLVPTNTPTRINFGQFRNLIYGDAESQVSFDTGNTNAKSLVAISIDRNRYKESLFPGTFNLNISYQNPNNVLKLTDNSNDVSTVTFLDCGRAFYIVSGSNGSGKNTPLPTGSITNGYTAAGAYGLFLPDIGTILLNPNALALTPASGGLSIPWYSGSNSANNNFNNLKVFEAISSGSSFQLNSQETISSDYIFVRIKNSEYNYTTNPSMITGSGDFIYSNFINSPQTYITSVGLYNTNNDLLAVAKLSKPLVKDFTKEALVRIKLDF